MGSTLGFLGALMSGGGWLFALAMAGICAMAMVGAYFTVTNRAHDGAPIILGCAVGVAATVLLYHFVLPLLGLEITPVEGFRLYALHVAPAVLLLPAAVLAYRLQDSPGGRSGGDRTSGA